MNDNKNGKHIFINQLGNVTWVAQEEDEMMQLDSKLESNTSTLKGRRRTRENEEFHKLIY